MSRIDELIAELCPDGVPHLAVGDIGAFLSGLGGKAKADFSEGNARFVSYRNVYNNLAVDQTANDFVRVQDGERQNELRLGDVLFTGSSETPDDVGMSSVVLESPQEPLYLNSFCFCLRPADPSLLMPAYSKYIFRSAGVRREIARAASGVTRFNISKGRFAKITIPVPPREVQREVARVLDDLTHCDGELATALSSESDLRRAQHAVLRESLLDRTASVADGHGVALRELVHFVNAKPHEKLVSEDGSVALLTARFISSSGKLARWVHSEDVLTPALTNDIAMVMSDLPNGRALARCFYVDADGKYAANQRVCLLRVLDASVVDPRYLYHFLDRSPQLLAYDNGQDQTHLKKGQILDVRVPLVSVDGQVHIATTLERLDSSISPLLGCLHAEQVARRKQYEYYRDRLLTFKEAAA